MDIAVRDRDAEDDQALGFAGDCKSPWWKDTRLGP